MGKRSGAGEKKGESMEDCKWEKKKEKRSERGNTKEKNRKSTL